MPAVMHVHCVYSSAFVDYADAHTDHICAHVHLPTHPEPSLTLDNLTSVFDGVVENMDGLVGSGWLQIPDPKQNELKQQYDRQQIKRAFSVYFMSHHPAPSWLIIANALWEQEENGALEVVQKLYLKGEPCANSCRSEGRMSVSQCLQPVCSHFSTIHPFFPVFCMQFPYFTMSSIYSVCIKPSYFFSIFKMLCLFVVKFPYKY